MSEYTNYYVVKASSEKEVQSKLNDAKIMSLVDADKADYWFEETYKRNGVYNWVVVSAPADSRIGKGGTFYYNDMFDSIAEAFGVMLHFFESENCIDWNMKLKADDTVIKKDFKKGEEAIFSEEEKTLMSACFDKDFSLFGRFLQAGKACDFLNSVGIPYMQMNDQDQIEKSLFIDRYSLLAGELREIDGI